ncbi:hypothetical protein HXX76_000452 [Chlamydomonas incerta]|uniref:Uncharacterized protein n=1 Tax=Chlamydomonas incerta TaxID=51695 RepID=A0A835WEF3_CHLIN|nr:hypothetical protein HXX76_000452 [Chlamydomonas incerta]|eukprot:KAG2445848.1 hypothetical protein HXX76_000452 [Chlamydomonas incerta]
MFPAVLRPVAQAAPPRHGPNGYGGGGHSVGVSVELDAATRERLLSHGLASTSSAGGDAHSSHNSSKRAEGRRVAPFGGGDLDGGSGQGSGGRPSRQQPRAPPGGRLDKERPPQARPPQQALLQQQLLQELVGEVSESEAGQAAAAAAAGGQGRANGVARAGLSPGSPGRQKGAAEREQRGPRGAASGFEAGVDSAPEPMMLMRAGEVTMEQLLQQSLEQRQPPPPEQQPQPQQRRRGRQAGQPGSPQQSRQQRKGGDSSAAADASPGEGTRAQAGPASRQQERPRQGPKRQPPPAQRQRHDTPKGVDTSGADAGRGRRRQGQRAPRPAGAAAAAHALGPVLPVGQGTPGLEAVGPGRRGLQRQPHLRRVHDEKYGSPPEGIAEARSVELTENIRTAANLQQLAAQLAAHADVYNAINITAFAARLAQLAAPRSGGGGGGADREADGGGGDAGGWAEAGLGAEAEAEAEAAAPLRWQDRRQAAQLAARLGEVAQKRLLDLDPEGVVTLLHAFARLSSAGVIPTAASASAVGSASVPRVVTAATAADAGKSGSADAAAVAAAAAAAAAVQEELLADLVFVAGQNLEIYHAQAVSNLVWALGSLAPRSAGWAGRGWWEGLFLCSADRVAGYPTQALANIMWALGRLRQRPPATWQRAFFSATAARLHLFTTQGVANYVQGAAKLQLRVPTYLMEELMRYGASNLRDFSGQGLVLYLWGMAKLIAAARTSPEAVTAWLEEALLPELKRRLQLGRQARQRPASASARSAATAASSGSSSGSEDDEDGAAAGASGGGGASPLTLRQLAMVLYGLAELGYAPAGKSGGSWLRSYWAAVAAALEPPQPGAWRGGGGSGGEEVQALSNLLHSAAELRLAPPPALLEAVLGRCRGLLAAYPPQALSSTAWSLHRLRVRPPAEWLGAFMQACWFAMPRMSCTELATLLYGLSGSLEAAGMAPEREWLRRAEGEWLQGMDRSGPVELYRGLAALAGWRHCPGPEWQAAMLRQLAAKLADLPTWQLPQVVRHLADVGAAPPLPLLNALVAGAVGGRVAAAADLALLVTGLARLGRQVSPRLLASLLAELNALALTPELQQQQQQQQEAGQRGRGRGRGGGGAGAGAGRTPTDSVDGEAAGGAAAPAAAPAAAQQAQPPPSARGRGGGSAVDVLGLQLMLDTAWALAALRHTPAALWVAGCLAAVEPRLSALTPQQLEAALAAAAHLRHMTGRNDAIAKEAPAAVMLVRPGPGRSWLAAAEARLRVLQSEADAEARSGPRSGPEPIAASLQDADLEEAVAAGVGLTPAVPVANGETGSAALLFVATPAAPVVQAAAAQAAHTGRRGTSRSGRWGCLPGAWRALRDAQSGQQEVPSL